VTLASSKRPISLLLVARGCEASDLSFGDSEIYPADPGWLTSAINIRYRSLLRFINDYCSITDFASNQHCEFYVGNKVEATRQVITLDFKLLGLLQQNNAAQPIIALRLNRPATKPVWNTRQSSENSYGLRELSRMPR